MDLKLISSDAFFYSQDHIWMLILICMWWLMTRVLDWGHVDYESVLGKMRPMKAFVSLSFLALGVCCALQTGCFSLLSKWWPHIARFSPVFVVIIYPLLVVIIMYYCDLLSDWWFLLKEMISFWTEISFRKAFTADLLTSVSKVFLNIPCTWFILFGPKKERKPWVDDPLCYTNSIAFPLLITIPYFLRFLQCLREGTWRSFINAGKFLSLLLFLVFQSLRAIDDSKWKMTFVVFGVVSSCCSIIWNIFFDWDILGRWKLVELSPNDQHIVLRLGLYTWFVLVDSVARFLWYFKMISPKTSWVGFLFGLVELFRRLQWMYIRIEREARIQAQKKTDLPISRQTSVVDNIQPPNEIVPAHDDIQPNVDIQPHAQPQVDNHPDAQPHDEIHPQVQPQVDIQPNAQPHDDIQPQEQPHADNQPHDVDQQFVQRPNQIDRCQTLPKYKRPTQITTRCLDLGFCDDFCI